MEEKTREDMITMVTDSGESVDFYVLEETRINVSGEQEPDAVYEFVEDDSELDALMKVFEELLSDADVDLEK